jgi:hypothetical protein
MESFEYSGVWWVADDPSARVAGVLRFTSDKGLILDLLGTFGKPSWRERPNPIPRCIIVGIVFDSPLGDFVTLKGCRNVGYSTRSSGLNTESYRSALAFFGGHLSKPDDFLFSKCRLEASGLSGWADHRTGIQSEYDKLDGSGGLQFNLAFKRPPSLDAEIPGGMLHLDNGFSHSSTLREHTVKEQVAIGITSNEPLGEVEWNLRFVYPLLNFLTLATDTPNALKKWSLSKSELTSPSLNVVMQRVFNGSAKDLDVSPDRMLLPLEGYEGRFPGMISRWLVVAEEYRDTCNTFFALRYDPGAYVDVRLLAISQALELYHARRANVARSGSIVLPAEILAQLSPKAQTQLRRWAESLTVDNFSETLRKLADEHKTTLIPLSPNGELHGLLDEVVKLRSYVLHRDSFLGAQETYSHKLYLATETLSCLMKSCFLAELGFTPKERETLFQRNAMYGFLLGSWPEVWGTVDQPRP